MLPSLEYENNGKRAENMAARFLQNAGHKIIAKNFKIFEGEIDIISLKNGLIYVNEVKKRSNASFKFVTEKQLQKIWYTFETFLLQNPEYTNFEAQFQLLAVQNNKVQILDII